MPGGRAGCTVARLARPPPDIHRGRAHGGTDTASGHSRHGRAHARPRRRRCGLVQRARARHAPSLRGAARRARRGLGDGAIGHLHDAPDRRRRRRHARVHHNDAAFLHGQPRGAARYGRADEQRHDVVRPAARQRQPDRTRRTAVVQHVPRDRDAQGRRLAALRGRRLRRPAHPGQRLPDAGVDTRQRHGRRDGRAYPAHRRVRSRRGQRGLPPAAGRDRGARGDGHDPHRRAQRCADQLRLPEPDQGRRGRRARVQRRGLALVGRRRRCRQAVDHAGRRMATTPSVRRRTSGDARHIATAS